VSSLPRVPHATSRIEGRYAMESWLTPEFARQALATGGLCQKPRRNERFSQQWRYECYAQGLDPDRERDWPLVWREPYTGRCFGAESAR